jgi:hypothetical protein
MGLVAFPDLSRSVHVQPGLWRGSTGVGCRSFAPTHVGKPRPSRRRFASWSSAAYSSGVCEPHARLSPRREPIDARERRGTVPVVAQHGGTSRAVSRLRRLRSARACAGRAALRAPAASEPEPSCRRRWLVPGARRRAQPAARPRPGATGVRHRSASSAGSRDRNRGIPCSGTGGPQGGVRSPRSRREDQVHRCWSDVTLAQALPASRDVGRLRPPGHVRAALGCTRRTTNLPTSGSEGHLRVQALAVAAGIAGPPQGAATISARSSRERSPRTASRRHAVRRAGGPRRCRRGLHRPGTGRSVECGALAWERDDAPERPAGEVDILQSVRELQSGAAACGCTVRPASRRVTRSEGARCTAGGVR